MNILYIAVSCSPYHGSEDKIGWNIPIESAGKNRVFVLTREDQRCYIEDYMEKNRPQNIQFFYVDIPKAVKWLYTKGIYSVGLNIWHSRALRVAEAICKRENIEVIHQITPVEFRSIGNYGSISGVKFVCGPIAGGQKIPKQLEEYLSRKQILRERLRDIVNRCSSLMLVCSKKLHRCEFVMYANRETEAYLTSCTEGTAISAVIPDISVAVEDIISRQVQKYQSAECRFLVAARLVYLKGHSLLLDALASLPPDLDYECVMVGQGPMEKTLKQRSAELGLDEKVVFRGAVPYEQMAEIYDSADVLILPSFREASGSVILEAMTRGLPVITMNRFGGALLVDENTGWMFDGISKEECISQLRGALVDCILKPEEVRRKGENARQRVNEFTWGKKVDYYQTIYDNLMKTTME